MLYDTNFSQLCSYLSTENFLGGGGGAAKGVKNFRAFFREFCPKTPKILGGFPPEFIYAYAGLLEETLIYPTNRYIRTFISDR